MNVFSFPGNPAQTNPQLHVINFGNPGKSAAGDRGGGHFLLTSLRGSEREVNKNDPYSLRFSGHSFPCKSSTLTSEKKFGFFSPITQQDD